MKNMIKKNQVMITALAIMIAVAGYLNFAGTKVTDEEIMTVNGEIATDDMGNLALVEDDIDYSTLLDLSEEDIEQAGGDIQSLDSDVEVSGTDMLAEVPDDEEVPGEAVFTSSTGISTLSGAKLQKEQTRAQNKEMLLEIINNANISESQKQEAVNSMISMTDIAEKETAAEILLEAKGFTDAIVSIDGDSVDVVVNTTELTEAQRAQIEDIVIRKTGVSADAIVISTVNTNEN
ncbi:MAG: SpoIIIAH-like family protein [Roseburia sp.]|nr:SpoIIIAH-like family protein [Ruminococcus sp.]MCM1155602.1 SpoIIIAH-like family protein [Roseburia sp.]MCM1243638.1 SpoIIIAH-like family protein [Roseburia sp.]